jgi:hypothetical protein
MTEQNGSRFSFNGWVKIVLVITPLVIAALIWGGGQTERQQRLQTEFDAHLVFTEKRLEEFNAMKTREATMIERLANIEKIVQRIEYKVEKYK